MKTHARESRGQFAGAIKEFEITAGELNATDLRHKMGAHFWRFHGAGRRSGSLSRRRGTGFGQPPATVGILRPNNRRIEQRYLADDQ